MVVTNIGWRLQTSSAFSFWFPPSFKHVNVKGNLPQQISRHINEDICGYNHLFSYFRLKTEQVKLIAYISEPQKVYILVKFATVCVSSILFWVRQSCSCTGSCSVCMMKSGFLLYFRYLDKALSVWKRSWDRYHQMFQCFPLFLW